MALSPDICAYLRDLALRMDGAGHGATTPLVDDAARFLGWSRQTVYRQLRASAGWSSGRRARKDKGSTSVSDDALVTLAAAQREAIRDNGKQTLFTTTARGILEANGIQFGVSNHRLNRIMRDRKLNVAAQRQANVVQDLRAPHPNYLHEVDPSLCLVYYLRGHQFIMRDREFYKNKLENYAKVKLKVYRYVLYDRASATVIPWYTEAAGETQHSLFEFLMFAWGQQAGRPFHGVPRYMLWDKGSANTSAAVGRLLDQLEVTMLDHKAGQARVKGGVEQGNNLVETQFESRLRFEPVDDVLQLNAAAFAWANAYNANLIQGQDTRLRRAGLTAPLARYDLWQRITAEQLRLLPDVEVCRALMAGKDEERQVSPKLMVQYKHPQADRSLQYSLRGLDGVNVGDKVQIRALVYGDRAIQVQVPRYDGETMVYRVEPELAYDEFGQSLAAAVVGEEFKSARKTEIERAADDMDAKAYPGLTADEADAARDKRVTPFEGKLRSHSFLEEVELPTYLPRTGSEIAVPAHARAEVTLMDPVAAMLRIVEGIGRSLTSEEYSFFSLRYAAGVPEDQLAALVAQFKQQDQQPPQRAAGGLRAV